MQIHDFVVRASCSLVMVREQDARTNYVKLGCSPGVEWYGAWQQVLRCCRDCNGLERLAPEINQQSQEFSDLPEVIQAMQQLWNERWQELEEAIA